MVEKLGLNPKAALVAGRGGNSTAGTPRGRWDCGRRGQWRVRILALALLGLATPAAAQSEAPLKKASSSKLPAAKIGLLVGVVHGTLRVANDFGFGWTVGPEVAWQPIRVDRSISFALSGSALFTSFGKEPANLIAGSISAAELAVIGRVRWSPRVESGRFLSFGVGGSLLRMSSPVAPDNRRAYQGALVELGAEQHLFGNLSMELRARLGPIATGPTLATGLFGLGFIW